MAQPTMARRIIISCDGTWNDSSSKQPYTNVIYFQSLLAARDTRSDGIQYEQIPYYVDGIGSNQTWYGRIKDGAFGTGIHPKIFEGYRNLCLSYTGENDEIVLTGFSRGAFTAQCLAQFVNDVGLLRSQYLNTELPRVYELWAKGESAKEALKQYIAQLKWDNKLHYHKDHRIDIPINVYAVWDTVKSVAFSGLRDINDKLPPNIKHAYHALALDEKRSKFLPLILEPTDSTTELRQVWFSGSHSDIGGSNASTHGLAAIALQWMYIQCKQHMQFVEKAEHKLAQGPLVQNIKDDHEAIKAKVTNYESYTSWWRAFGATTRPIGGKPAYEKVHESVKYITSQYEFPSRLLKDFENPPAPADEYDSIDWSWKSKKGDLEMPQERFTNEELRVFEGWIVRDRLPRHKKTDENGWVVEGQKRVPVDDYIEWGENDEDESK